MVRLIVAAKEFNVPESKPSQQKPETKPTEPVKESYKNCTELRAVYPGGVMSGHPAYELQHDADNDGWACEPVEDNNTKDPISTPTPTTPTKESFKIVLNLEKYIQTELAHHIQLIKRNMIGMEMDGLVKGK